MLAAPFKVLLDANVLAPIRTPIVQQLLHN